MNNRNKSVECIRNDFLQEASRMYANEYPYNAKFNCVTGKITHRRRGLVEHNKCWYHLSPDYYPIYSTDGNYIGWHSATGFKAV